MRRNQIVRFVLGLTIAIALALRVLLLPSQRPIDIGLFDNAECGISCWQGLRPGQSNLSDVEGFYRENFDTFLTHEGSEGLTSFSAIQNDGNYNVITSLKEDILVDLFLRVNSAPSFDLQIDIILETLGSPEYILVSYDMSVETPDIYPYIDLYYPEVGYVFQAYLDIEAQSDSDIEVCVESDLNVSEIHVVAPNSISNLIIDSLYYTGLEMSSEGIETLVNNLSQWTGYQCYTLLYPPIRIN